MSKPGLQYEAKSYARYRPTYPLELYTALYDAAQIQRFDTALDVATGTGQVAQILAKKFAKVIGTDISSSQLGEAVRLSNITYLETPAETLDGVPDSSVDLITVAEAFHWFDHDAFYKACKRVLRPDGVVAIWGYTYEELTPGSALKGSKVATDKEAIALANAAFAELHSGTFGPYWENGRKFLDERYAGQEPREADFDELIRLPDLTMEKETSLNDLIGYLQSWSPYARYLREHPEKEDPLVAFKARIAEVFGIDNPEQEGTILNAWPLFGFLGKNPKF